MSLSGPFCGVMRSRNHLEEMPHFLKLSILITYHGSDRFEIGLKPTPMWYRLSLVMMPGQFLRNILLVKTLALTHATSTVRFWKPFTNNLLSENIKNFHLFFSYQKMTHWHLLLCLMSGPFPMELWLMKFCNFDEMLYPLKLSTLSMDRYLDWNKRRCDEIDLICQLKNVPFSVHSPWLTRPRPRPKDRRHQIGTGLAVISYNTIDLLFIDFI